MAHHNITGRGQSLPRNGWKIIHYSRFLSDGQEVVTSHTVGLPGIFPHIRENIHIRGLEKERAEKILDGLTTLLIERKKVVEPGDTIGYEHRKFLVLRESIPSSICTRERSILVLRALEPTEKSM